MTDRTDRWLLLVVALIGVALLVPAVSAHGTNETTGDWTDWMQTNVWGGDAPDDVGPHATTRGGQYGHHGGGHHGPADGGYGPGDGNDANYRSQGHGPHAHGPHHGWSFEPGDERPTNASYHHGSAYVNGSVDYHGVYANGTSAYHHGVYANDTSAYHHGVYANGTYYPGDGDVNGPYHADETRTDGTGDSEWRYRGGPGGCH